MSLTITVDRNMDLDLVDVELVAIQDDDDTGRPHAVFTDEAHSTYTPDWAAHAYRIPVEHITQITI